MEKRLTKQQIVRRSIDRNMEYLKSSKDLNDLYHRHGVARGNARAYFDLGYLSKHDYRNALADINDTVAELEARLPDFTGWLHRCATVHYQGFKPDAELQKVRYGFTVEKVSNPLIDGWLVCQYVNKRNINQQIILRKDFDRFCDCISALHECLQTHKQLTV